MQTETDAYAYHGETEAGVGLPHQPARALAEVLLPDCSARQAWAGPLRTRKLAYACGLRTLCPEARLPHSLHLPHLSQTLEPRSPLSRHSFISSADVMPS